jgi:hypothetical protein
MALLYSDKENGDELETFLSSKPHHLPANETLGQYWQ